MGPVPNLGLQIKGESVEGEDRRRLHYTITPIQVPAFTAAIDTLEATVKRSRMKPGDTRTYERDHPEDPWRKA